VFGRATCRYATHAAEARRQRRVVLGLSVALGMIAFSFPATAVAHAPNHRSADRRILVRKFVRNDIGAYVRARSGQAIFVPPGVMSRSGYVTITALGRHIYDIHIGPRWHGTVAVTIPLVGRSTRSSTESATFG
jgi:hypothetical protein